MMPQAPTLELFEDALLEGVDDLFEHLGGDRGGGRLNQTRRWVHERCSSLAWPRAGPACIKTSWDDGQGRKGAGHQLLRRKR
jgi:hypothetical protein